MRKISCLIICLNSLLSYAQPSTDIYLFDMNINNETISLSNPVNITHRKGYDNQPSFSPKGSLIYYTSAMDTLGNTEIKTYNYSTKKTNLFTHTPEGEYSPTVTPDRKFVSCIFGKNVGKKNGTQFLIKYPIGGGKPIVLIDNLVVGYHTWVDNKQLVVFILGESGKNSLHHLNLTTKADTIISNNPGKTIQKIAGENTVGFIDKSDSSNTMIKKIDLTTFQISNVCKTIGSGEFVTWINKNLIIMSDGKAILYNRLQENKGWEKIKIDADMSLLKGITRLAVNGDGTKLAVVVAD